MLYDFKTHWFLLFFILDHYCVFFFDIVDFSFIAVVVVVLLIYHQQNKQTNKQTNKQEKKSCSLSFDLIGLDLIWFSHFASKAKEKQLIQSKQKMFEKKENEYKCKCIFFLPFVDCSVVLLSQVFGNKTSKFIHFCSFFPIKI